MSTRIDGGGNISKAGLNEVCLKHACLYRMTIHTHVEINLQVMKLSPTKYRGYPYTNNHIGELLHRPNDLVDVNPFCT